MVARGRGVWVKDAEGKATWTVCRAYSALNQGHRHPQIIEAIDAGRRVTLTSRAFHNDQFGPFLKKLAALSRHGHGAAR